MLGRIDWLYWSFMLLYVTTDLSGFMLCRWASWDSSPQHQHSLISTILVAKRRVHPSTDPTTWDLPAFFMLACALDVCALNQTLHKLRMSASWHVGVKPWWMQQQRARIMDCHIENCEHEAAIASWTCCSWWNSQIPTTHRANSHCSYLASCEKPPTQTKESQL